MGKGNRVLGTWENTSKSVTFVPLESQKEKRKELVQRIDLKKLPKLDERQTHSRSSANFNYHKCKTTMHTQVIIILQKSWNQQEEKQYKETNWMQIFFNQKPWRPEDNRTSLKCWKKLPPQNSTSSKNIFTAWRQNKDILRWRKTKINFC